MKWPFIFLCSLFALCCFIPEASAKHHCRSRTSFGLSFNFAPAPNYVAYNYVAPAPVAVAPVAVAPYGPVIAQPIYYPYAQQVIVQRPYTGVYVGPQVSYSYWRY